MPDTEILPPPHCFDRSILREYDIRGIVGETLFAEDATAIGRAFGTLVIQEDMKHGHGRMVCVGYDGRVSSPEMEAALVEGLLSTGVEVQRVGRGPTPMLYYAGKVRHAAGAIMVTGSHNPANHNGFKLVLNGQPFFANQIQELGKLAAEGNFAKAFSGPATDVPVLGNYVARLLEGFENGSPLKVVWDPGNGAAGEALGLLLPELPGEHILINGPIDGTFPNHHPDPTEPENLEQLIEEVIARGADLGFAFDGDGDRIGVVDAKGRILWGDQMMMLLAEDVLARKPGATIIADVKASQALFDRIAELGGVPLMWRTGHSLIKTRMAETGAPLAGEMSGHLFFGDLYYGFDDALYAAVRFLAMASHWQGQTLADRYDALPRLYNTPEIRIPCPEETKFETVTKLKAGLAKAGATFSDIDGVRVNTGDGWWLLRASNTQAALVARCESGSEDGLARLRGTVRAHLKEAGLEAAI